MKRIIFGALLLVTTLSFAQTQFSDPSKPILVNSQVSQFSVRLNSNPTTGYSWQLTQYDPSIVTPSGQLFIPPTSNLMGAGGAQVFTFEVRPEAFQNPHGSQIKFIYVRPWNKEVGNTITFRIPSPVA